MTRILALLLALLPLGAPARAQEENGRTAGAVLACLRAFPDASAARAALLDAGYRREGSGSGLELLTAGRRNLIAAFGGAGRGALCAAGRDGLRDEAAVAVAQAALDAFAPGQAVRLGPSADGQTIEGWIVATPRGGALVTVSRQINMGGVFRGSLIAVQPAELPQ